MVTIALLVGVLLGPTGAQETPLPKLPRIDRTLPGMRTGVLQEIGKGRVTIDGTAYVLAAGALVETDLGRVLSVPSLPRGEMHAPVQFWLGTGAAKGQVTGMIVTSPR
jgi:hypothetical protein